MATKLDIEQLCAEMATFMRSKLNTRLLALDSEKNDGITLKPVTSTGEPDGFFFQDLGDRIANFDPFVLYGIDSVRVQPGQNIGPATAKTYTIHVIVVIQDNGNDPSLTKRLLRYQRALWEIFEVDWATVRHGAKFKIGGLMPIAFELLNRSQPDRAVGISLEVTLA